jgi:hypothetical protein
LAFTLSFIWSRQVNWLRQEECDEKYLHGNSEKKQEINQKCLIINDRLIWSKYISLFFAGV